jgi:hypothetical protein
VGVNKTQALEQSKKQLKKTGFITKNTEVATKKGNQKNSPTNKNLKTTINVKI